MKRVAAAILACLLIGLSACAQNGQAGDDAEKQTQSQTAAMQVQESAAPSSEEEPGGAGGDYDTGDIAPEENAASEYTADPSDEPEESGTEVSSAPVSPAPAEAESSDEAEEVITVKVEGLDGEIILDTDVPAADCETVCDALTLACEKTGTELTVTGSGKTTYVRTIGSLSEMDEGPLSGWVYKINGTMATAGAGACPVAAGDRVSFYYTLDLGADAADKE